jgi:hypothetical protein
MSNDDQATERSNATLRYLTWRNFWIAIAVYTLLYVVYALGARYGLGASDKAGEFGDMFGAVNAYVSGLAMFGVLIAILLQRDQNIMQAVELRAALREAKEQTAAFRAQVKTAEEKAALDGKTYIEGNKPIVFCDRVGRSDGVGFDYVMRNVGGGFAINVYFIAEDAPVPPTGELPVRALGSLAADAEKPFPETLRRTFCDSENHPVPHIRRP